MVRPPYRPWQWWANPDVTARARGRSVIRRSRRCSRRSLRNAGNAGPSSASSWLGRWHLITAQKDGKSPLGQIVADWQIDVPVIDIAIVAQATPMPWLLLFPCDGHLNEPGHAFVAAGAIASARTALSLSEHSEQIGEGIRVKDSATMVD